MWRETAHRESTFKSCSPVYAKGFSYPESAGRWTDSDIAVLELPVTAPTLITMRVALSIKAYLPRGTDGFTFTTATGVGAPQAHELCEQDHPSKLILDACVVGAAVRKIVIVFHLIDARSPLEWGKSEDPRFLGLFFDRVEVLDC